MSFKGKNALITGSSRGIGRGVALKLAKEGAQRETLDAGREARSTWKSPEALWRDSVRNSLITIFLGLLTVSVPLFAHHGNAAYDTSKRVTLKATVTAWIWANPHCFLKFDAKDDKGNVVHWLAETSNPSDMANLGWSKETFKPGDEATVTFMPVKNGNPIGRIQQVVLANGQTFNTRVGLQILGHSESPK